MILTENRSPLFGIMLRSYCLLIADDADDMVNLGDHAANFRGIRQFGSAADLVELEADQRRALRVMAADCAAGLLDLDRLCGLGHDFTPIETLVRRCLGVAADAARLQGGNLDVAARCDRAR